MALLTRSFGQISRTAVTRSSSVSLLSCRYKSSSSSPSSDESSTSTSRTTFPELFDQTVVLSNGATFTLRTPSPRPQIRLTRDTRNHPLWNPELRGGASTDDSGQLSKFSKKFGDMDGFGSDVDFADGGDVDRKALTPKQVAQAAPTATKGKKKK
ncbi:hypothetical protein B0O80DRAFT_453048 [Mortierella sp. GBAus27b]|nr:hypothetical protein BGX31_006244 [Mortierella sp. GBA43]KAI8353083.1 hypothetical protein B0O80DRAFT_453048 [Mortierella sp. GBAus27b]